MSSSASDTSSMHSATDNDSHPCRPNELIEHRPPSPTSSIRACYVRSRPTSTNISDTDISGCSSVPEGQFSIEAVLTALYATKSTDHTSHNATPGPKKFSLNEDDGSRSIYALSSLTTQSHNIRVCAIRRSEDEKEQTDVVEEEASTATTRRITWPRYDRMRKTVSSIFSRKDSKLTGSKILNTACSPKPRRSTISNPVHLSLSPWRRPFSRATPAGIVSPPVERKSVRRSRSFAGFTSVLASIKDAEGDVDEATTEANIVMHKIRKNYRFEEIAEEDAGVP